MKFFVFFLFLFVFFVEFVSRHSDYSRTRRHSDSMGSLANVACRWPKVLRLGVTSWLVRLLSRITRWLTGIWWVTNGISHWRCSIRRLPHWLHCWWVSAWVRKRL